MNGSLSCSANNCVHYTNNMCTANKIHVSGLNASITPDTHCSTFQERNLENTLNSLSNLNINGEIKQFFTNSGIVMYPEILPTVILFANKTTYIQCVVFIF